MACHWLHCVDARPGAEFEAALRSAGLETTTGRSGAGILYFEHDASLAERALRELSQERTTRVLVVAATARALTDRLVWRLLHAGAQDVLAWDRLPQRVEAIAARLARWEAVDEVVFSSRVRERLVGRAPSWIASMRQIVEVALFGSSSPVLILGESGTGKEEVARLVHELDPRTRQGHLVTLDCSTVVAELSGSEFFGHERGAFTGALSPRDGAFALADKGTLFLDEVGELPLTLQAQLLRAVQERAYKRVGGNTWQQADFRLICATNRDLDAEIRSGRFRGDFFHRIASSTCRLPPLRERLDDVVVLAEHFLRQLRPGEPLELDELVKHYLLHRSFPGNVRELRHLMVRLVQRHAGPGPLTAGAIPPEERPPSEAQEDWRERSLTGAVRQALAMGAGLKEIGRASLDIAIRLAIADEHGNLQRAAKRLGVTDRALQLRRAHRVELAGDELGAGDQPAG